MPYIRPSPHSAAGELAAKLNARRAGNGWMAVCPAHSERTGSLHISEGRDGRPLVHCFGGCGQEEVVAALRSLGLWASGETLERHHDPRRDEHRRRREAQHRADRIADAARIWGEAGDPRGTIAEQYLGSRKLDLPPDLCGAVLRFHPRCPWEHSTVPCLIAAFRSITTDQIVAIHRIRVDRPERWPSTQRLMFGPVGGAAVKLDPASDRLVVGEGVETCMAARQLGLHPVWALGSAGAIKRLAPVPGVTELLILGENDGGTSRDAADACNTLWRPRSVYLIQPPAEYEDLDDLLMEKKRNEPRS